MEDTGGNRPERTLVRFIGPKWVEDRAGGHAKRINPERPPSKRSIVESFYMALGAQMWTLLLGPAMNELVRRSAEYTPPTLNEVAEAIQNMAFALGAKARVEAGLPETVEVEFGPAPVASRPVADPVSEEA